MGSKRAENVKEFTLVLATACFLRLPRSTGGRCTMKCDYDGFKIESFEIGKGLWHARIRRADLLPVIIDGVLFSALEVGFAWSDPDAAIADAKTRIDHFNLKQYVTAGQQAGPQIAA